MLYKTGEAEAYAIEVKAKAEAEGSMTRKADAWKDYGKPAMIAMMLKKIPLVAAEITHPMVDGKLSRITMVSDGTREGIGASAVTDEVVTIMNQLPSLVNSLTGVNLTNKMLSMESS